MYYAVLVSPALVNVAGRLLIAPNVLVAMQWYTPSNVSPPDSCRPLTTSPWGDMVSWSSLRSSNTPSLYQLIVGTGVPDAMQGNVVLS